MKKFIFTSVSIFSFTVVAFTQANKTLSNLAAPTAVNTNLLPGTDGTLNLGSPGKEWKNVYLKNFIYLNGNKFISNTTGGTFVGPNAGNANTGFAVTGVGTDALSANTGNYNTAVGYSSLYYNNSGTYNTAIGYSSLYSNTTGYQNTACGHGALSGNNGHHNTAVGDGSLAANTSGNYNTAVGTYAGYLTSDYCTYVGYSTSSSFTGIQNSMALGYYASVSASNQVRIGNPWVTSIGGQVGWTTLSDGRFKKNIKENVPGLAFIKQLRPVTYNIDAESFDKSRSIQRNTAGTNDAADETNKKALAEKSKIVYTGFIAQEVEATTKKLGYDFSGVDAPKNDKDYYGLRYQDFVMPLVKAVQELSKMNDDKDAVITKQQQQLNDIIERLSKLEKQTNASATSNQSITLKGNYQFARLEQNAPNPFNQTTAIKYYVPQDAGNAIINITDANGMLIKSVALSAKGNGQFILQSGELAAATYQYSLIVNGKLADTKKMVVLR